ncbi:MAG: chloride channel protein [Bacteriovoracaceae bacterium]
MLHKWPYWISAFTVGLIAVLFSKAVTIAENFAVSLYKSSPEYLFLVSPFFFLASWALVYFFAPEAKGNGIPQVMASVEIAEKDEEAQKLNQLLGIKIALIKICSSLLCLLGGGALGREGPTLQISASIFYSASKKFNFFKQYIKVETWIITGAAAGLAAAFNTPLGGLVYAIEELATQHLNKFKTSLITAVIIAGFSSQMIAGPYLYLGYPKLIPVGLDALPLILLISFICGLAGSLFGHILFNMSQAKLKHSKSIKSLILISLLCGLLTAFIAVFIDYHFMGSGKELLIELLFTDKKIEWHITILRFFAPILTYFSGGAGGIFAPSLAAGGHIGHFIADILAASDTNLFTLLGMIAFLTGVTRAPFTAFILVLEMTDRHSSIFPMMLSAVVANSIAKMIHNKSFYDLLKNTYLSKEELL